MAYTLKPGEKLIHIILLAVVISSYIDLAVYVCVYLCVCVCVCVCVKEREKWRAFCQQIQDRHCTPEYE